MKKRDTGRRERGPITEQYIQETRAKLARLLAIGALRHVRRVTREAAEAQARAAASAQPSTRERDDK